MFLFAAVIYLPSTIFSCCYLLLLMHSFFRHLKRLKTTVVEQKICAKAAAANLLSGATMSPIIDYIILDFWIGFIQLARSLYSLVRIFKASCHQRASSIILESQKPGQDTHVRSCTLQRHNIPNLSKLDSHVLSACKFIIIHQLRNSFQLFMLSNSCGATLARRVGGPCFRCSSSWKIWKLVGSLAHK